MEMDAIVIINLLVFLLFLAVFVFLYHLVLSLIKSKAKEAAKVGATYLFQRRSQILQMAKSVKMLLFGFTQRKYWFLSFKQQIQTRTSLGPNSRRGRQPFGSKEDFLSPRGMCLHMQGKGPISCLTPAKRIRTGLPEDFTFLVQSCSTSHCFPKIRANPVTTGSQSLDNLIPSDSWAKIHKAVGFKSNDNLPIKSPNDRSRSKPTFVWEKNRTEVKAKYFPRKRIQATPADAADDKKTSGQCKFPHLCKRTSFHASSYLRPKKSTNHGKSCLRHQDTTTTGNTKSLFCLEKFQS